MDLNQIDTVLARTLDDMKLSRAERKALDQLFEDGGKERELEVIRSRAFVVARECLKGAKNRDVVEWLEGVVKAVEAARKPDRESDRIEAWFSPGTKCRDRVVTLLNGSRRSADVCVFAITDNTLSRAILDAHRRGVKVRIITDDQKVGDLGSDVTELAESGVSVATDSGPAHMHHKFAVVDGRTVVTGSYNWTRSASTENHENIVVIDNPEVVRRFEEVFERLWKAFGKS
ncbi:MAG: phospholipase D-like domain-containing protein [Acidobacteriota bacterium]